MKALSVSKKRFARAALGLASAALLAASISQLPGQTSPAKKSGGVQISGLEKLGIEFPYEIDFEPYSVDWGYFAEGDQIVITSVRSDRPHIEVGGTYIVEGTYALRTMGVAQIGLSITVSSRNSPGAHSAVDPAQVVRVARGTGTFSVRQKMNYPGSFHVSLNSIGSGPSRGTVYFRETFARGKK